MGSSRVAGAPITTRAGPTNAPKEDRERLRSNRHDIAALHRSHASHRGRLRPVVAWWSRTESHAALLAQGSGAKVMPRAISHGARDASAALGGRERRRQSLVVRQLSTVRAQLSMRTWARGSTLVAGSFGSGPPIQRGHKCPRALRPCSPSPATPVASHSPELRPAAGPPGWRAGKLACM